MNEQTFELLLSKLESIEGKVDKQDKKLDKLHEKHVKLDKDFSFLKLKMGMFVAILVGAKEAVVRKFL